MENLLQKALVNKLRFSSPKGNLTTEQLFELTYKGSEEADSKLWTGNNESFSLRRLVYNLTSARNQQAGVLLGSKSKGNTILDLQIEVATSIYEYLETVAKAKAKASELRKKANILMEASQVREVEELVGDNSAKDLRKQAAKLAKQAAQL